MHRPGLGIGLYAVGVFFQTAMDAAAKWLSGSYPVGELAFARALFALLPIIVFTLHNGGLKTLVTRRIGMQILSGLAMAATILLLFGSFRLLPLADALSVFFAGPLFMTLLAALLLRERIGPRAWGAIALGFLGVVLILRPTGDAAQTASLLALGAALTYALSAVSTRSLARTDSENAILFYSTLVVTVVGAGSCFFNWVTPAFGDLKVLVLLGLLGAIGNYFVIRAFYFAEVRALAPFDYTALVWAAVLGYVLWGDVPTLWVCAGAGIIIVTGIYVARSERAAGRHRSSIISSQNVPLP
jgi:drug/metabolite transporter (DMT)-like permease